MDYDVIYEKFLDLCGYDYAELPQTDALRYRLINNGVDLYNQKAKKYESRLQGNIICDDDTESINKKLTSTELMILAYFMCKIIATTKYTEFTSLYGVVASEMGLKDYKAQCTARESTISYYEKQINNLVEDEIDSFTICGY